MRTIKGMLASKHPEIAEHGRANFGESSYVNAQGKRQPMYRMTAKGLSELTMSFSSSPHHLKIAPRSPPEASALMSALAPIPVQGLNAVGGHTQTENSRCELEPGQRRPDELGCAGGLRHRLIVPNQDARRQPRGRGIQGGTQPARKRAIHCMPVDQFGFAVVQCASQCYVRRSLRLIDALATRCS